MSRKDINIIFLGMVDWKFPLGDRSRHLAKHLGKLGILSYWFNRPSWVGIFWRIKTRRFFIKSVASLKINFFWFHFPLKLGKISLWLNVVPAKK
jgi:hypothetical protein